MNEKLHSIIRELASRRQSRRFHAGMCIVWGITLTIAVSLLIQDISARNYLPHLLVLASLSSVGVFLFSRRGAQNPRLIAKDIEKHHPELDTGLLAALDQSPDPESGKFHYLQERLIADSLASAHRDNWVNHISLEKVVGLNLLNIIGAISFIMLALIMLLTPLFTKEANADKENTSSLTTSASALEITVEPGDIEVEQGTPLTISAKFTSTPTNAVILETTTASAKTEQIPFTRSFTEPIFLSRLAAIAEPLTYRVLTGEQSSPEYKITTYIKPKLVSSEVVLRYPIYLEKEAKTIKDPRVITITEGTKIDFSVTSNLPNLNVSLHHKKDTPIQLQANTSASPKHSTSFMPSKSARYEIVIEDTKGRRNGKRDILNVKVIPNKAPIFNIILPRKKDKATPIQELQIEAEVIDKTGLTNYGLRYTLDGQTWVEPDIEVDIKAKTPRISKTIDLEAAGAKPKDIVIWTPWAEDIGPNGELRHVSGDLNITAVRAFDQEYYEKNAPEGEGAAVIQKLLELQEKITISTWNLIREHKELSQTPVKQKEAETLHKSQNIAIDMAKQLEMEIEDPAILTSIKDARLEMATASEFLLESAEKQSVNPLDTALTHEQRALRYLNQLMNNKTMIMHSKGHGESGESHSQKPKNDLELNPVDNPYENEKRAQAEETNEAIEALETLKRLDLLAKRIRDLNEEIKALELALKQAQSQSEKAELQRRLEQLREQQRDLMTDVDNLKEKAEQQASDEQKQALDDMREELRKSGEELSKNNLGNAHTAGTKAQEQVEKIREELSESSTAKLAEQLQNLRNKARNLEEQIKESNQENRIDSTDTANTLNEQKPPLSQAALDQLSDYQELIDDLRLTVETAEQTEPLVAKDLDEALRQADQDRISDALENVEYSQEATTQAKQGITKLRKEIDKAAARILGNEAQALRYARDEIDRLRKEMGQEASNQEGQGSQLSQEEQPGEEQPGEGEQVGEGSQAGQEEQSAEPGQIGQGNQPGQEGQSTEPGQMGQSSQPGQEEQSTEQGQIGQGNQPGQEGQPTEPGQMGQGSQAGQEEQSTEEGQIGQGNQPGQEGQSTEPGQMGQGSQPGQEEQSTEEGQAGQGSHLGHDGQMGQGSHPGHEGQSEHEGQSGKGKQPEQPGQHAGQSSSMPPQKLPENRGDLLSGNGNSYGEWRDRMSDLDAIISVPEAQTEVSRALQAAQTMRKEYKRYAEMPNQERIEQEILAPLREASQKINERLIELDKTNPLAPISRDPVPEHYNELVRKYFEVLGQ